MTSLGSSFSVPIGGIIAYTGALNALPLNYHLCDGTDGTPDLRDRFIVGVTPIILIILVVQVQIYLH